MTERSKWLPAVCVALVFLGYLYVKDKPSAVIDPSQQVRTTNPIADSPQQARNVGDLILGEQQILLNANQQQQKSELFEHQKLIDDLKRQIEELKKHVVLDGPKIINKLHEDFAKQDATIADHKKKIEEMRDLIAQVGSGRLKYAHSEHVFGVNRPDGTVLNEGQNAIKIDAPKGSRVVATWYEARDEIGSVLALKSIICEPEGDHVNVTLHVPNKNQGLVRIRFHLFYE